MSTLVWQQSCLTTSQRRCLEGFQNLSTSVVTLGSPTSSYDQHERVRCESNILKWGISGNDCDTYCTLQRVGDTVLANSSCVPRRRHGTSKHPNMRYPTIEHTSGRAPSDCKSWEYRDERHSDQFTYTTREMGAVYAQ